jgi:hypothetical protein
VRCLVCGRAAERGEHERDIRRLTGWLLAIVFTLGIGCGALLVAACAGLWAAL